MSRLARTTPNSLSGTCTGFATTPLSITCWVKLYGSVSSQVVSVGTVGSANNYYFIGLSGTNLVQAGERDAATTSTAQTASAPSNGVWHNLTAVFAAHNDRRIYFDGANKATSAVARTCGATTGIALMGDPVPTGDGWPLDLAHVALWNIALSDADATQLYAIGPAAVQAANLVEYWPLYGNKNPEPSTQTANSLTVAAQYSPADPFANFSRLPYSTPVFMAA